jgi:hypothetical protein
MNFSLYIPKFTRPRDHTARIKEMIEVNLKINFFIGVDLKRDHCQN